MLGTAVKPAKVTSKSLHGVPGWGESLGMSPSAGDGIGEEQGPGRVVSLLTLLQVMVLTFRCHLKSLK